MATGLLSTNTIPDPTVTNATTAGTTTAVPTLASTAGVTAATTTPTNWNVTANQTVAGQLPSILDPNSQLMAQAAAQGNKASNARGLLNSSIGVGAAQDSMLKVALPIAQQDATTNANSAQYNATAANSSDQFNANASNTANQFTAAATNTASLANLDSQTKAMLQSMQSSTSLATAKLSSETQLQLANLDAATKTSLANTENSNKQLLQTNVSAANLFSQYLTDIANISSSTTMDQSAKDQAAANQLNIMNSSLAAIGAISGLDLSKYFQAAGSYTAGAEATSAAPSITAPATSTGWVSGDGA